MVLISIIVPIYKTEKYLERCIRSIQKQTYGNLEIILVDDGSPDNSGMICDKISAEDKRIKVLHKENGGVSAARNDGMDIASGDYITFVDSDDYIESDMYQSMIKIIEKYDCDVVMCDCVKEFFDHTEEYSHDIRPGYYDSEKLKKEYFDNLLIMPNIEYPPTISNCLCLFKKNIKPKYIEGVRYSEDLLFGAQLIYNATSFYYMKGENFYHYNCENIESATHQNMIDKWNDFKILHKNIKEKFGNTPVYNFSIQIDKVLLFFVYHVIGNIYTSKSLNSKKYNKIIAILEEKEVENMFRRLNIKKLPISKKQKIITMCYKYKIGIKSLIRYYK